MSKTRDKRDKHIAFRLDDAMLARVDALRPRFTRPWHDPTRSEVLRVLLLEGLEILETRHAGKAAPR